MSDTIVGRHSWSSQIAISAHPFCSAHTVTTNNKTVQPGAASFFKDSITHLFSIL